MSRDASRLKRTYSYFSQEKRVSLLSDSTQLDITRWRSSYSFVRNRPDFVYVVSTAASDESGGTSEAIITEDDLDITDESGEVLVLEDA